MEKRCLATCGPWLREGAGVSISRGEPLLLIKMRLDYAFPLSVPRLGNSMVLAFCVSNNPVCAGGTGGVKYDSKTMLNWIVPVIVSAQRVSAIGFSKINPPNK